VFELKMHLYSGKISYSSLVSAFPRTLIRQLSSGAVARGSYKPRTVLAESSSLSWSILDCDRAV